MDGFGADEDRSDGAQLERLWGQFVRFADDELDPAPQPTRAEAPRGSASQVHDAVAPAPVQEWAHVGAPSSPLSQPAVAAPPTPSALPPAAVAPPTPAPVPPPGFGPPPAPPYYRPPTPGRVDPRAVKIAVGVVAGAFAMLLFVAVAIPTFLGVRQRAQARAFPAMTGTPDAAIGEAAVVNPTDLGSKWTLLRRTVVPVSQLRQPDPSCPAEPAVLRRATSQSVAEYSFDLTSSGMEAGHLTSSVLTYATPEEASRAFAFFQTPEYQACEQQFTAELLTGPPNKLSVQSLTATPFDVDSVPGALGVSVRAEAASSSGTRSATFDAIHFNVGRTIGVLRYRWCSCASADAAAVESSNAQTVAARLDADIRTRSA